MGTLSSSRPLPRRRLGVKIEYDAARDLLYLWLGKASSKTVRTVTVAPGVFADFDTSNKLIGLEVLDDREVLGETVQLEVALSAVAAPSAAEHGGPSVAR